MSRRLNIISVDALESDRADHREILIKKLMSYAQSSDEIKEISQEMVEDILDKSKFLIPYLNEPSRSTLVMGKMESIIRTQGRMKVTVPVDENLVTTAFSQVTKFKLNEDDLEKHLKEAKDRYRAKIIGDYDPVFDRLFNLTEIAYRGQNMIKGPMVRMLLGGDAGLGKTERAITYAKSMGLNYLYVNPSMGFDIVQKIADELRKDPFTVIILDEIEKYPGYTRETLLGLLGEDSITISKGKTSVKVTTAFATVIATTNAGEEKIASTGKAPSEAEYNEILQKNLGRYLASRFPSTTRVRLENYSENNTRAILMSVVEEVLERNKKGLFKSKTTLNRDEVIAIVNQAIKQNKDNGHMDLRSLRAEVSLSASNELMAKSAKQRSCVGFYKKR